jgi:hypothetical protein
VLDLGLDPIRLSVHWDEVDRAGHADLDRQVDEVERAGRGLVLTVGMKAQGWPEFYVPDRLRPAAPRGSDVIAAGGESLRAATLELVAATVERYHDRPALVAWQVENEPLNPSGPNRWWIDPAFVREEMDTIRRLDPGRPLCVNAFAHFSAWLDVAASRYGVRRLLGGGLARPEAEALSLLGRGDVLGLDVYRGIGARLLGRPLVHRARDWDAEAARWLARARAADGDAWVIEAQAEPWQPWPAAPGARASCRPEDGAAAVGRLRAAGFGTVLLWGVEHWLAEEAAGRPVWVTAAGALLEGR